MGLGVGVRVRWFQLPRRRGQGQRGRTGIRVPGGALVSAREPAPGVRSRRGTSRERPGRLSPGRVERLGSLGGSMAQEAGKGFGKPKPWGQGAPPGQDHGGHPDLWREEDTQQRDRPQHGGTVRGQLREDGHAGSGVPASPGAHGHAGRLTHSGCRDLGSRTNRRQREVGRAVGGAGVTVTTATIGGRRHLGRGAKQTDRRGHGRTRPPTPLLPALGPGAHLPLTSARPPGASAPAWKIWSRSPQRQRPPPAWTSGPAGPAGRPPRTPGPASG